MFARRTRGATQGEETSYWVSFADVMAGLLIVFILAVVALMLQLMFREGELDAQVAEKQRQEAQFEEQIRMLTNAEQARTDVLAEIQAQLKAEGIEVVLNTDSTVLSIPTSQLGFASGEDEIPPASAHAAQRIGEIISDVLRRDGRTQYLDTVFIEGHTDAVPYDAPKGNWGLSTYRAISLWQLWEERVTGERSLAALTNSEGRPLFSVSGYANTRPVENAPAGAVEFEQNRRIDIRITIVRPSSEELEAILEDYVSEGGAE